MIFHNINQTELDFGSGDIVVSPFAANDNSYVGVSFRQADKCYEVGKEFEDYDDYLNFDNVLNDYINFLYDYYYDKQSVDKYYEKIDTYFNSLFSILELKIDLLNHNDIKSKIKIEYDLLTDKILNLLTNINIIVNNKF